MGELAIFRCISCGHEEKAPDNSTGRYSVMMGTIQLFRDNDKRKIFGELISRRYFDDDHRSPLADLLVRNYVRYGSTLEDVPLGEIPEAAFDNPDLGFGIQKWNIQPWNAHTCGCPVCRKKMVKVLDAIIMVD